MSSSLAALALSLPNPRELLRMEIWYYAGCALIFLVSGLICGYFIWRRGHMQTYDAEAEVRRAAEELQRMQEDLRAEEKTLEG